MAYKNIKSKVTVLLVCFQKRIQRSGSDSHLPWIFLAQVQKQRTCIFVSIVPGATIRRNNWRLIFDANTRRKKRMHSCVVIAISPLNFAGSSTNTCLSTSRSRYLSVWLVGKNSKEGKPLSFIMRCFTMKIKCTCTNAKNVPKPSILKASSHAMKKFTLKVCSNVYCVTKVSIDQIVINVTLKESIAQIKFCVSDITRL